MSRLSVLTIAAALCLQAAPTQANGRFPQSMNVHVQPGNDQVILLAVTFGLLISRDGGATFQWVCEEALGYGGRYDPDYEITEEGTIFATTWTGLRVARDGGCVWENVPALVGQWVEEVETGPGGELWAATASLTPPNRVYLSTDNAATFTPMDSLPETLYWKSLRVAPSDRQRVYVTGYTVAQSQPDGGLSMPAAYLFRTDDRGATWQELPLTDVDVGPQAWFLLMEVAPDNPDVVFARSAGVNPPGGDALYRTTDGGTTWTRVLDSSGPITGMIIRQNGHLIVGTQGDGVHTSTDGGTTWTRSEPLQMRCVAENAAGELLACGANWEPDFMALGRSTDGVTWEKVFRFSEMQSPYPCAADTEQYQECEVRRWPAVCEQFACAQSDAGPQPDAGSGPTPSGGCCDASPRPGGGSMLLALAVLLFIVPRRARS